MSNPKKIKILVSCPGDVTPEKEEIIRLATVHSSDDIIFEILDYRDHVGQYGVRLQEQLTDKFGEYDVYIGILWKRFGTPSGAISSDGEEYNSGTEEEYYDAMAMYDSIGKPKIHFFIKNFDQSSNKKTEADQLSKVFDFIEEQEKSKINYLNKFISPEDFNSKLITLFRKIERDYNKDSKSTFIEQNPNIILLQEFEMPLYYINRTFLYNGINKKYTENNFYEFENHTLEKMVLENKRTIILGDAGSGKTTELERLNNELSRKDSPYFTIHKSLNTFIPNMGLEDFLHNDWQKVPKKNLVILLDGLDEIQSKDFIDVVRQINNFSDNHADIHIVISCRINFYDLPKESTLGTLTDFEPYIIKAISIKEAADFYEKKYSTNSKEDGFEKEIYKTKLYKLIEKPFFLDLIADYFYDKKSLTSNRAELYKEVINRRIKLDQTHFRSTEDLRIRKQEIQELLQKVALSMEIVARNFISESDILKVCQQDEFRLLKYSSAFKKKDGEDGIWQFEHNNIQEYLAAIALSKYEFERIIQFIAFGPDYIKINPSWVNTLSFLFNILQKGSIILDKLVGWLAENNKEILVKLEPAKIHLETRNTIFKELFKHYKNYDTWISSNQFQEIDLASFGETESNFKFLIDEIKNIKNTETVIISAILLLGHFYDRRKLIKKGVDTLLFSLLKNNLGNSRFVHHILRSIQNAGFTETKDISKIMKLVDEIQNQYVRSSMYYILADSDVLEEYVDYLIDGYKILDSNTSEDRDSTNFLNESWNLNECIKKIKTTNGIKAVIDYIISNPSFEYGYNARQVLDSIIVNAVNLYDTDPDIFKVIFRWFTYGLTKYSQDYGDIIIKFFDDTNTRQKAFEKLWESKDTELNQSNIAKILNTTIALLIIDKYKKKDLAKKDLEKLRVELHFVENEDREKIEKLINDKTDLTFHPRRDLDKEKIEKYNHIEDNIELLCNKKEYMEKTLEVFDKRNKKVLSFKELFRYKNEKGETTFLKNNHPDVVLELLRYFARKPNSINKKTVLTWFDNVRVEESYRISLIYKYLLVYEIELNKINIDWIVQWCILNAKYISFEKSVSIANYIIFFSIKYNIPHSEKVFLKMLSYNSFGIEETDLTSYVFPKLKINSIISRMIDTLEKGVECFDVQKRGILFLLENGIDESHNFILAILSNSKFRYYEKLDILNMFFEYTKEIDDLKSILNNVDEFIKWDILSILLENEEEDFVEEYLLKLIKKKKNDKRIVKRASKMLVRQQNMVGLKLYVDSFKQRTSFDDYHDNCISELRTIDAIPFLIELLELSYTSRIESGRFENLNSLVLDGFYRIGLESQDNLDRVKLNLNTFIKEKSHISKKVKFILQTIERMEAQFYINKAQSYTIDMAKNIMKI